MTGNFNFIGLSYKNAPLEVREKLALSDMQCKSFLSNAKNILDVQELLVLSTCNRTEIYFIGGENLNATDIIKLLCIEKGISNTDQYLPFFILNENQDETVHHLFSVAMGLESQVIGDLQISNQVKNAYQWSADASLAGPFIHRLLHTIFFTNKKVVQETSFRDGAASVSYATVELIETLTSEILNPKILVVGLGEIGTDVCKNLADAKGKNVTLCNRTFSKAEALAKECNFEVLPFENLWKKIADYDVIISSIVAEEPYFTKEKLEQQNIFTYKYFIDLSVPRSVSQQIEQIPGILVYNIDQIRNTANEALEQRIKAIPHVRQIVEESIIEFNDWTQEMIVSPTIHKLKNALEQIRTDELSRFAKQLNENDNKLVDQITKNIMQKIIKLPVLQLKAACKRGEAETLIDVLNDLFDLEKVQDKKLY